MVTSTVALLGTLRELHTELPRYDLGSLEDLVSDKNPDLLCVEIDREDWESGNLEDAPIEGRDALAQVTQSSDITLVPLGAGGRVWADSGMAEPCCGALAGLRRRLFRQLDGMIVRLMKLAGGPRAINSRLVEHLCATLCHLQEALADGDSRRTWRDRNEELLDRVLWIVGRDPGRRILVAVDCRRKHWLRNRLGLVSGVTLVDFWRF